MELWRKIYAPAVETNFVAAQVNETIVENLLHFAKQILDESVGCVYSGVYGTESPVWLSVWTRSRILGAQ